ncbi:MAG TPA: 16S rRNA (adenine(1518)-N(6)/adenine(1519)-N(6))-dimethyltransferase RsmA [Alloiococcus sp.]|nr:16S rRNA (adenine(1518)-N(6)/adenine(1519)-N(6))-dimethyltransferase RsmA [Alloiococcus sp.]
MSRIDIATPSRTIEIQQKYGIQAKKSLGQNFIIDTNILHNIVKAGSVDKNTIVIEVGPGIGALTEQIAKVAKHVYAFEIDQRLLPVLDDTLSPYDNVTVLNEDILEVDLSAFFEEQTINQERVVVMANLPYYITTPIIINFLESSVNVDQMIFMIQKEVAERIAAEPSTKAYGSLSIAVQYYAEAETLFIVPKTVFRPQPNVESAIIRLNLLHEPAAEVTNEKYFFTLTRSSFAQRRKTLWNNLKIAYGKEPETQEKLKVALDEAGIDSKRRGETLTIQEFADLANSMLKQDIQSH